MNRKQVLILLSVSLGMSIVAGADDSTLQCYKSTLSVFAGSDTDDMAIDRARQAKADMSIATIVAYRKAGSPSDFKKFADNFRSKAFYKLKMRETDAPGWALGALVEDTLIRENSQYSGEERSHVYASCTKTLTPAKKIKASNCKLFLTELVANYISLKQSDGSVSSVYYLTGKPIPITPSPGSDAALEWKMVESSEHDSESAVCSSMENIRRKIVAVEDETQNPDRFGPKIFNGDVKKTTDESTKKAEKKKSKVRRVQ